MSSVHSSFPSTYHRKSGPGGPPAKEKGGDMKKWLYLGLVTVIAAACNTEPGGKEVGWRADTQSNNPDTLLETGMKTSGHYRAWVGQTLSDIEIAWGEPDSVSEAAGGGTAHYKKGREYENMNSETWFEYCEVTLSLGAGEVIQAVDYQGRECRHPLMQYLYQTP